MNDFYPSMVRHDTSSFLYIFTFILLLLAQSHESSLLLFFFPPRSMVGITFEYGT